MTAIEEDLQFVCYGCIGDAYLKAAIKAEGKRQLCTICGNRRRSIDFDSLRERVHQIVSEEFERTASEPDNWALYKVSEFDWQREGDHRRDFNRGKGRVDSKTSAVPSAILARSGSWG
jgi:hypothetical protein